MVKAENKPSANTEQIIIEAARRVFIKKGYAGARMQEIADESGINKALLHYYFRSKEKLFAIIFKESFLKLLPQLIDIFKQEESIREKIKKFVASYIGTLLQHPYIPVFVLSEIHRDPQHFFENYIHPEIKTGMMHIRQSFADAVQKGEIRPVDPRQIMMHMLSLCAFPFIAKPMFQHVLSLSEQDYEKLLQERIESVSQLLLTALEPQTPASSQN